MAAEAYLDLDVHIPPQSTEAEMSTLGAMILSERAAHEVSGKLSAGEFYVPAHREIFTAISWLIASNRAIDLVTLRDRLIDTGKLDDVGGVEYLVQLAETVPSAGNAEHYANIVREKAVLRSLEAKANQALAIVRNPGLSTAEKVEQVASDFAKLLTRTWSENPIKNMAEIPVDDEEVRGLDVGFPSISNILSTKGLPLNQITIVQADSGIGKTPMMMQMALNAWRAGHNVCYAVFADLNDKEWKRRLIKQVCGHSGRPVQLLDFDEYDAAIAELNDPFNDEAPKFILYDGDTGGHEASVEAFTSWIKAYQSEYKFSIVCHDYIQRMRTIKTFGRDGNTFQEVSHIANVLRQTYKKIHPPLAPVVGSQVTQKEGGKTVARYGQALNEDAAVAIEILKEAGSNSVRLRIPKNRFGRKCTIEGFEFDERRLIYIDPEGDW